MRFVTTGAGRPVSAARRELAARAAAEARREWRGDRPAPRPHARSHFPDAGRAPRPELLNFSMTSPAVRRSRLAEEAGASSPRGRRARSPGRRGARPSRGGAGSGEAALLGGRRRRHLAFDAHRAGAADRAAAAVERGGHRVVERQARAQQHHAQVRAGQALDRRFRSGRWASRSRISSARITLTGTAPSDCEADCGRCFPTFAAAASGARRAVHPAQRVAVGLLDRPEATPSSRVVRSVSAPGHCVANSMLSRVSGKLKS